MIFCVEDDSGIRDLMIYTLHASGFEAEGFPDAGALWEALRHTTPQLIMLDIMLPGMDGIQILKKMRENKEFQAIPVIMATAKGEEYDKIHGLDLGADYYLAKPFGVMELVSCVKAVLRRCQPKRIDHLLKTGNLIVNLDEHTVTANGERILLTFKEFEILRLFLSHPGMVYTRDQLFNDIWGMDYCGETRTVDMHIRTLRQKLGIYGKMIETVRGVGYRLEAIE